MVEPAIVVPPRWAQVQALHAGELLSPDKPDGGFGRAEP